MKKTISKSLLVLCAGSSLALSAFSSNPNKGGAVLPNDGPSMTDIYNGQIGGTSSHDKVLDQARLAVRPTAIPPADLSLEDSASNSVPKMLPNPTIMIYVYPHFDEDDQNYVPAHRAYTKLYEEAHFALPGEIGE